MRENTIIGITVDKNTSPNGHKNDEENHLGTHSKH